MGTQYIQSYTAQASLADTTYSGLTRYTGILDSVDGDGYAAIATLKASGVEASEAVTAGMQNQGRSQQCGVPPS